MVDTELKQAVLFKIYAEWKKEADVWVASSSDLRGFKTEAGTLQALEAKLDKIIPAIFELNGIESEAALIVNSACKN